VFTLKHELVDLAVGHPGAAAIGREAQMVDDLSCRRSTTAVWC
jgi:hypothetical protein